MGRKNLLVRIFRALPGLSQRAFAEQARIHHVLLNDYEMGWVEPGDEPLARCARVAGLTVADGEKLLGDAEERKAPRQRAFMNKVRAMHAARPEGPGHKAWGFNPRTVHPPFRSPVTPRNDLEKREIMRREYWNEPGPRRMNARQRQTKARQRWNKVGKR